MQANLFRALGSIAGIGGIALGVFLFVFRDVLQTNFLQALTQDQGYRILIFAMFLTFGISALGIFAWAIGKAVGPERPMPDQALYVLAALFALIVIVSFFLAANAPPPPPPPPPPRGPIVELPPQPPTPSPTPTFQPPTLGGYIVSGGTVRDKNGKAAQLIKIVSQEYNWALGKVDEVEFLGKPASLSDNLRKEGIRRYLEQLDAIIGVGAASNETVNDDRKKEEIRAMDRAVKIQHDIKEILSPPKTIAYYALSLGWNKSSPSGGSVEERKRNSAEQRKVIILGIKQQNEKVDFDSILTRKVIEEVRSLNLKLDDYSQFEPKVMTDGLQ